MLSLTVSAGIIDCGYISNDEPAYAGIFSMLLAAKVSDIPTRVVVNDGALLSGAGKIEWVNFK